MAFVFQRRRRDGKPYKAWFYRYKDATGKLVTAKGWPDKRKTHEHALAVEAEARAMRNGEKAAPPSWIKGRNRAIETVAAEYLAWGETCGGRGGRPWDKQHAYYKRLWLNKWIAALGMETLGDIDLGRVEAHARKLLADGFATKSVSLYNEALRSLCLWAVRRGLLPANPLAGMAKLDTRPAKPHRLLSAAEVAALLQVAPPERRLWYIASMATGFRLNELRQVRVRDLDPFGPSLHLCEDFSKDRKAARQFITRNLAALLTAAAQGRGPDDRLLGIPFGDAHKYTRRDMNAAGIKRETAEGVATFHSFRKVFINGLVASGVDLKTAMTAARHASASMTLDRYATANPDRLREVAEGAQRAIALALAAPTSDAEVTRQAVGAEAEAATPADQSSLQTVEMVGITGFEPVTSWL